MVLLPQGICLCVSAWVHLSSSIQLFIFSSSFNSWFSHHFLNHLCSVLFIWCLKYLCPDPSVRFSDAWRQRLSFTAYPYIPCVAQYLTESLCYTKYRMSLESCIAIAGIVYFTHKGFKINTVGWMNESKSMRLNIELGICIRVTDKKSKLSFLSVDLRQYD